MRAIIISATVMWILTASARPQEQQASTQQEERRPEQDQQQQQQQQQKRPTLGPAPAPTLYGPKTSNTFDARRLLRVRRVYVERIDNALDQKLMELIGKTRRLQVVDSRNGADAVLRGTCFDSRRLKQLRSEVYLNDPNGAAIWQDIVHRPINPPTVEAAVSETANVIVTHLSQSITEAERH